MFVYLLNNIKLIGVLLAMYIVSFGVNVLFGIYYNTKSIKEQFSKEKLIEGLTKGAIVLIGGLLITTSISMLPSLVESLGITVEDGLFEGVSIAGVAGVLLTMTIRYLKDAITKFYAILYNKKEEE